MAYRTVTVRSFQKHNLYYWFVFKIKFKDPSQIIRYATSMNLISNNKKYYIKYKVHVFARKNTRPLVTRSTIKGWSLAKLHGLCLLNPTTLMQNTNEASQNNTECFNVCIKDFHMRQAPRDCGTADVIIYTLGNIREVTKKPIYAHRNLRSSRPRNHSLIWPKTGCVMCWRTWPERWECSSA